MKLKRSLQLTLVDVHWHDKRSAAFSQLSKEVSTKGRISSLTSTREMLRNESQTLRRRVLEDYLSSTREMCRNEFQALRRRV